MSSPFDIAAQQEDANSKLIVAMEKMAEVYRVLLWEQTKQHGMSPIQVQILIFLRNHDPEMAKPAVLAAELNVSRPTISDAIKSLKHKKLILASPNPNDSRSTLLSLSQSGKTLTAELENYANPLLKSLEGIESEAKSNILHGLMSLLNELSTTGIITPQRMCFNCAHYEGDGIARHYCRYLKKSLDTTALRIDCPEHAPAA